MKAIQLLVNSQLPPDLRDYSRSMDAKSISNLMADVARKYPEQYERISKSVSDIGRNAAYIQGETLTLNDNKPVIDLHAILKEMDAEVDAARKSTPDKDEFEAKRNSIWEKFNERIDKDTSSAALAKGNNLAYSVVSGARGKSQQLKMMISTPGLYTDAQDDLVPIFVRNSFGEGLRPAEYLASTYGARKSVLCLHEDTLVRKPDGSSVAIKDIQVDDMVMGADIQSNKMPVSVVAIYKQGRQPVNKYIFRKAGSNAVRSVTCTENHKFLATTVNGVEVLPIKDIIYSNVLLLDGAVWRLTDVEEIGLKYCYDIEVDNEDHLFVLESGIIVSNSTKRATAKGGDLAKQMSQVAAHIIVTENDCGAGNGVALDMDDRSLRGRVLSRSYGGLPAGTALDRDAMASLRRKGVVKVIARSALTCQAKDGVCSKCLGLNALGKFPDRGESVGITASNSLSEPITQGALNCLVENTKVLMADYTEKNIQYIQVGDMVMGADIKGNISPTKVTHVWDQGMQPAQRRVYKTAANSIESVILESTEIHKVLSAVGNSDIPELLPAGYAVAEVSVIFPKENLTPGIDDPWAVFMGAYLGDGIRWNSKPSLNHHVTFSCADESEITDLNNSLAQFNVQMIKCGRSFDWRVVLKSDDQSAYKDARGRVLPGYRNPVKRKLVEWGLADKYAHEKRVPSCVWGWSKESVAAFMAGFIATDGSVYRSTGPSVTTGISFASCSKEMLEDIRRLLNLKLCVYTTSLTKTGKAGEKNHIHDMWQFTITRVDQVRRLYDLVQQYIPGVKRERLKSYMEDPAYMQRSCKLQYKSQRISASEIDLGMQHCYDITVDNDDSLFVLGNLVIISNSKHTGGAAGANRRFAGFPVINQFVQSPEVFPDKAVVSTIDGTVSSIMDAPQGGFYVTVNNEPHYVPPGYPAIVKVGDKVEAGDIMTQGLPDPGDVVDYKGLGAGRKYYADKLKELLDDSGMEADRRNTELMARAALDHVQITGVPDDESGYIPDDVISYSSLSNTYVPPTNTTKGPTKKFIGSYLQAPALHYTIGTKITPKLSKELDDLGYGDVYASPTEPVFKAVMPRLRSAAHNNTDWLASMHTSYLKKQISESAIRGEDTNIESNTHFAPRLAIGANFGDNITQTGKF